jgi:23S rRNA pseudouridine2605 synthase
MADERLQKVLARAGIASRRAAEELITKGRVKVDGRVIDQLGVRVDPRKAKIEVDGNRLMAEPLVYIVLHKPRGVMCTLSDPEGRPTVAELLKAVGVRVVPVGRLDFHTSGALLCTNDGDFSNALAHPRNKAKKVYVAKVQGLIIDAKLDDWRKSIEIDGRATAPAEVRRLRYEGDKTWLELTLREGRNRQVRRLGESTGSLVMRLARISHAGVTAEDLRPGQWRHLSLDELVALKQEFGVPARVRAPGTEAWEVQVKANAKVPRVAAAKHGEKPARERREAPGPRREAPGPRREASSDTHRPRSSPARGTGSERREYSIADRAARGRAPDARSAARPNTRSAARPDTRSTARPDTRSTARPDTRSTARPDTRSTARPERREARVDTRSTGRTDSRGANSGRPNSRSEARPDTRQARPDARQARPDARQARPDARQARPDARQARPDARQARPDTRQARPDPRQARPDTRTASNARSDRQRPAARDTVQPARVSSRDARGSSRRRGT